LEKTGRAARKLISEKVDDLVAGNYVRQKQDEKIATTNYRLNQDSPLINFDSMSDLQIYNLIRGQVHPLKGAYVIKNGERTHFDKFIPLEKIEELRKLYSTK